MRLITDMKDAGSIPREFWDVPDLADIVLDDGTYVRDVIVFEGRAIGVILGGHTGVMLFGEIRALKGRYIRNFVNIKGAYTWPLIGGILRRNWAKDNADRLERPGWLPEL